MKTMTWKQNIRLSGNELTVPILHPDRIQAIARAALDEAHLAKTGVLYLNKMTVDPPSALEAPVLARTVQTSAPVLQLL